PTDRWLTDASGGVRCRRGDQSMTTDVQAPYQAPALARRMAEAARRFVGTLRAERRRSATFPVFGDARRLCDYRPFHWIRCNGLWLMAMTPDEKKAAFALLETGVSARGLDQTRRIMDREATLREHERIDGLLPKLIRDPELYWWSVFGEPGGNEPWGWRV